METLRYVLLANGLLIVVSVAFYLLLRRETFFNTNRLMLWLGVLSVLVLPALQFPDWRPQRVRSAMQHTARVIAPSVLPQSPVPPPVTVTFPNGRSYPVTPVRRLARFGWSWQLALIGLYLAGVGGLFVRFLLQLVSIRRLIRRSTRLPYDTFTLVTNPVVDAPFSLFRWVVLNPARHTGDELEQILRHERVHVRQRHSLDMLMAEGVCIIFWMNPAAYLFRKLVHQTLEFCADQAVLAEGIDARSYQYNLLKVSLTSGATPIVNSFSTSQLRDRIRMMNRQRSGPLAFVRYAAWLGAVGLIILACRHTTDQPITRYAGALPATSPTRALVADLEDTGFWYRHMALFTNKKRTETTYGEPIMVSVKQDKLQLSPDHQWDTAIFIDGKKATPDALAQLSPDQVDEFFLMHQFENLRGADHTVLPYQLMIQTRDKVSPFDTQRQAFFTLLQAAGLSKHPLGDSYSFTMNQLLEATFFHNKDALVERTKDNHLKVYDEFLPTTEIFINNIRATPADVATIHVREVARLHTKEQPFTNWFRRDKPTPRFSLFIQTEPKRANRDSSYYVFSPFYTGDF